MPEETNPNNAAVAATNNNSYKGLAVASMVCGIVSLVFCWTLWFGVILAIVALVLGVIAIVKKSSAKGMAIAGVATGGAGLLVTILIYALAIAAANTLVEGLNSVDLDNLDWNEILNDIDWDD